MPQYPRLNSLRASKSVLNFADLHAGVCHMKKGFNGSCSIFASNRDVMNVTLTGLPAWIRFDHLSRRLSWDSPPKNLSKTGLRILANKLSKGGGVARMPILVYLCACEVSGDVSMRRKKMWTLISV